TPATGGAGGAVTVAAGNMFTGGVGGAVTCACATDGMKSKITTTSPKHRSTAFGHRARHAIRLRSAAEHASDITNGSMLSGAVSSHNRAPEGSLGFPTENAKRSKFQPSPCPVQVLANGR